MERAGRTPPRRHALLGLQGVSGAAVEPLVAASVLVLGLLVAARQGVGAVSGPLLAGGFALFHGLAHGSELAAANDPVLAMAGMYLATLVLHLLGLALGSALRVAPRWAGRATGAAVAASGMALLVQLA